MGHKESDRTERLSLSDFHVVTLHCSPTLGSKQVKLLFVLLPSAAAGNGNPLQYSCLENPMGGGAW